MFEWKIKIIGSTLDDISRLDAEILILLKYLSNVWRSLDLPLNKYEVELDFKWWINCIISDIARTPEIDVDPAANPLIAHVLARTTTSATFQIMTLEFMPQLSLCL